MYINLGTLRLQYTSSINDWMIIGEILDSEMSFEKPRLIRSVDELNIWFGKEYKDYNYLVELLNTGVTLYLYKPVSPEKLKDENYIDISEYQILGTHTDPEESLLDSDIDIIDSIKDSPDSYYFYYDSHIYGYVERQLEILNESQIAGRSLIEYRDNLNLFEYFNNLILRDDVIFYKCGRTEQYIWFENKIVSVSELQQNIYTTTESFNNRDTLAITNDSVVKYVYPKFNVDTLDYSTSYSDIQISSDDVNLEMIDKGYQTLAFDYSDTKRLSETNDFLIVNDNSSNPCLICSMEQPPVDSRYYNRKISTTGYFSNSMQTLGYQKKDNHLISEIPVPVTYFQRLSDGNFLEPNTKLTYELLSWKFQNQITIEFWSKTIGRGSILDDEDLIEVSIENGSEPGYYQISITRYGYTETYEGPLKGTDRLDFVISRESKLVYCNLVNIEEGLQTGTYRLRGAVKEENTREGYMYALSQSFDDPGEPVYPDYFLIPDKYKYISPTLSEDYDYYQEYETFLKYAKLRGCQFLIENDPSPYKISTEEGGNSKDTLYYYDGDYHDYQGNIITSREIIEIAIAGGDFRFNYTKDKDNWLIYFYQDMSYLGFQRPAYYVFLRGLLQDDYQVLEKDILYPEPTTDAYSEYPIEKLLETYKSNYLVCNNLIYYYKKYMDGDTYNTTGWMRFAASKIFREFEKNRWDYLGEKSLGKIELGITKILNKISKNFSIIDSIRITRFIPELQKNQISLGIDIYVNDLLKNNLKLDITLNYNKED